MNEELYKQHILDHFKRPRNFGMAREHATCARGSNPSCGDELTVCIETDENIVKNATFQGQGCAISIAAASMLTEKLSGMPLGEAQALQEEAMYTLLGVTISSGREKCALLAFRALQDIFARHCEERSVAE